MVQKLIFTLLAIAAVWVGFSYWNRFIHQRPAENRVRGGARPARGAAASDQTPRARVLDAEECPACGDYVTPAQGVSCDRPDCPYRRA